jgi:hypothetical protein
MKCVQVNRLTTHTKDEIVSSLSDFGIVEAVELVERGEIGAQDTGTRRGNVVEDKVN